MLDKKLKHDIDVVVDRIVVRERASRRASPTASETALDLADGIAILRLRRRKASRERIIFSEKFACPVSGFTISEIEPRLFSFNTPFGACPACDGLGRELDFDPKLVVPDEALTLRDGAIAPWAQARSRPITARRIEALAKHYELQHDTPVAGPARRRAARASSTARARRRSTSATTTGGARLRGQPPFEGVIPNLERRYSETDSAWVARGAGALPVDAPAAPATATA